MAFRASGSTDVGLARKENQDNYLLLPRQMLYAVADGMGGHAGGRQASAIAIETLQNQLENNGAINRSAVEKALADANGFILEEARQKQWQGMGTTLVLAFYAEGQWQVAHIGDSRAYVVNRKKMYAVTKDHSLVEELLANGSITQEEAKVHPHRNVLTRALGTYEDDAAPDWGAVPADKTEYLLLCSDGLYNMLEEDAIQRIVTAPGLTLEEKTSRLVADANQNGGLDNITVILIEEGDRQ